MEYAKRLRKSKSARRRARLTNKRPKESLRVRAYTFGAQPYDAWYLRKDIVKAVNTLPIEGGYNTVAGIY